MSAATRRGGGLRGAPWSAAAPRRGGGLRGALLALLAFAAFAASGCKTEMESTWRTREVKIDGQNEEWDGAMHIFQDQRVDVGLLNDERYLYLGLFAGDKERETQMLASGCTIWLTADGKKAKRLGVRFPHGLPPERRREFAREWAKNGAETAVASTHALDGSAELVNEDGPLMVTAADDSVQVAVKPYRDALIYELKVPLARIAELGAVSPGQEIGIGIELGSVSKAVRKSTLQSDPREGRETRNGHGDGAPSEWMDDSRARTQGSDELSLWIVARLAAR